MLFSDATKQWIENYILSNSVQSWKTYLSTDRSSGQAASIPVSVVISSQILGSKESGSSLVSSLASDPVELNFVIMDNISVSRYYEMIQF